MRKILIAMVLFASGAALAGRPTPKGDSMAQLIAVMDTVAIGTTVLNVRRADVLEERDSYHYIVEFQNHDEEFCRARGYIVTLEARDPLTAAPTYAVAGDELRRTCSVYED